MAQRMLDALDDVPFRAIASLTPLVVAIHNLEEYPRLVPYARRCSSSWGVSARHM